LNAINDLKQLQHLSLEVVSHEGINMEHLNKLTQLRSLSLKLNDHPIKNIDILAKLKNLERLEIAQTNIGIIPNIFDGMSRLKSVKLYNTGVTKVPVSLFNLPLLEDLDLSYNQITTLPDIISYGCKNLKRFTMLENKLIAIPKAFEGLSQLEVVDCAVNQIKTLPKGWEYFQNLKKVNFARNLLTEFPSGLQNNHSVESITLFFNQIEAFPDVDGEGYKLRYLGLTGNQKMFELPEHIGKYTELEELEAQQLNLKSLPESLGDCKKLKMLLLTRSIATKTVLPVGLKTLKDLEVLYLNENPLLDHQSIFDVILAIPRKNLVVNLSADIITHLPAIKKWLTTPFKSLDLTNNPISILPAEFIDSKIKGAIRTNGTHIVHY
jgi:Leucine-rich repeat (LRR) protein